MNIAKSLFASSNPAQSHAGLIPVRKLNPYGLKSIPDYGQRRSALLTLSRLEYPDPGGFSELPRPSQGCLRGPG